MMKFFRKRQKELLAVAMAGLLIIWLGGSAFTSMFNYAGPERNVVARTNLGKITIADQNRARFLTGLIEKVGGDWKNPLGRQGNPILLNDWIVLTREADKLGVRPDSASVRRALTGGGGNALLLQRARELDVKVDHIVAAYAQLMAIQQAASIVGVSAVPSEATIRLAARNVLEKVRIKVATLPARAFLDEGAPVSEEEITAHYATYRESQGGVGLDFGYVLPAAVKVEYVKIDRDLIADDLRVADTVLEKQARDYWDENKESDPAFRRPPEPEDEDAGKASDAADDDEAVEAADGDDQEEVDDEEEAEPDDAEEEPPEPPSPFYETWDEARDAALGVVREQRADRAADRIVEWLANQLRQPWYVPTEADGYKTAPQVVQAPDYLLTLVTRIPDKLGYPGAVSVVKTDFFSSDQARDLPDIGLAVERSSRGGRESLQRLALNVQGLTTIPTQGEVDRSKYLSLYQPSNYVLEDSDGNRYLFRVVQTRQSQPPESVDDVRDSVIEDVRRLRAFNTARARADELAQRASGGWLK